MTERNRESGWTIATYAAHNEALRLAQRDFDSERDRRLTEVNLEKEKALKIKERADEVALGLAREIQTYKDKKANELREQINSERGHYATKADVIALSEKMEAANKPIIEFMATAIGHGAGLQDNRATIAWAAALIASLMAIGAFVFRSPAVATPVAPQIIYVPAQPGTLLPSTQPQPGQR